MSVHCVGGHTLVPVLFVAVLITQFLLNFFHYLYEEYIQLRSILIIKRFSTIGKTRQYFTPYQQQILVKRFQAKPYLEPGEKHQLARSLNTSDKRIRHWFKYRRCVRRKQGLLCKCMSNLK